MTLEQLRIFVGVAEREHMTRAAEALHVTQSTVSAAVAALESEYGVPLFHRIGRGIELTDAGRAFLVEAREVLDRAAGAERVLSEFNALKRGSLRLVASQTIAGYWLPGHLATYSERYPQVTVTLDIANTEQAEQRVLAGAADLGFVEGGVDQDSLDHWPVGEDRLLLVSRDPAEHVDDDWLRKAQWIMREHGSGTRSTFEKALAARGIDPAELDVVLTLPSNESVRTAVEAGAGVAALSALVVARAVSTGVLRTLPLELPARPFYGLQHTERYRGKAACALLNCIEENQ
jgi:DNA-binding transcriptional LysR family regulator